MSSDDTPRLERIEERLDGLTTMLTDVRIALARMEAEGLQGRIIEQERRITSLERWRSGLIGAYGLLVILYGIVTDWFHK